MNNIPVKLLSLCSLFLVVSCTNNNPTSNESAKPTPQIVDLLPDGGSFSRLTEAQQAYIDREDYSDTAPYNGNLSREDVSFPKPIELSWKIKDLEETGIKYQVDIYKGSDIAVSYITNEKFLKFYNSEVGTSYTYKVSALDSSDKVLVTSEMSKTFETEKKGPRHLYVEGVENMRDLGGWGYIKQGMIYRSGRFNEDSKTEPVVSIKENGLKEVQNHLHIKTEIDLRRTSTNEVGGLTDKSVLGDSVRYVQIPMYYGGNNILTFKGNASKDDYNYDNPAAIKSVFDLLANEANYPVDFHCSIGKDRTGCISYLVEGLLGFDQETMYRDYMFTNFSDAGMCKITDITTRYGKTLEDYENGSNINEKVYNYLNEVIGVSKENLDNIISILGVK